MLHFTLHMVIGIAYNDVDIKTSLYQLHIFFALTAKYFSISVDFLVVSLLNCGLIQLITLHFALKLTQTPHIDFHALDLFFWLAA